MPKLGDALHKGFATALMAITLVGGVAVSMGMAERFTFLRHVSWRASSLPLLLGPVCAAPAGAPPPGRVPCPHCVPSHCPQQHKEALAEGEAEQAPAKQQ